MDHITQRKYTGLNGNSYTSIYLINIKDLKIISMLFLLHTYLLNLDFSIIAGTQTVVFNGGNISVLMFLPLHKQSTNWTKLFVFGEKFKGSL